MTNNYPTIFLEIDLDDLETGTDVVSFVTQPATMVNWTAFSDKSEYKFDINEAERMVTGPIMLADTPIYRFSDVIGPYYVKFSKQTLKNMMIKYQKNNKNHRVNENHDAKKPVSGVFLVESFIVGDKVESKLYPDLPDGTWMGTFYVEDKEYWTDKIMSDEFNGFSLEGVFDMRYEDELIDQVYSQVEGILFSDVDDNTKISEIKNLLKIK